MKFIKILFYIMLIVKNSNVYSLNIIIDDKQMASFVGYINYYKYNELKKIINQLTFDKFDQQFIDKFPNLMVNRTDPRKEIILNYLAKTNDIKNIEIAFKSIKDSRYKKDLIKKVKEYYQEYIKNKKFKKKLKYQHYISQFNQYLKNNNKKIESFVSAILHFTKTKKLEYKKLIVLPFYSDDKIKFDSFIAKDTIFLATDFQNYTNDIGTVIHEIFHLIFMNQPSIVQKEIEKYYLNYKSSHALLAYTYLNEALASSIGNGLFEETYFGKANINYNNKYVLNFANGIYEKVKSYLKYNKQIDIEFLSETIKLFEKLFPNISSKPNQILSSYVILSGEINLNKSVDIISKYFYASTFYMSKILDDEDMRIDIKSEHYCVQAPVICVLSEKELLSLKNGKINNLYISKIPKEYINVVKYGRNVYIDSVGRIHIFFIVKNIQDLEFMVRNMSQSNKL